jgi:hypothetical protein
MRPQSDGTVETLLLVRRVVISGVLAQTVFWLCTMCYGLLPFDLVFLYLTFPALLLGSLGRSIALAAGLSTASLFINLGLLVALLKLGGGAQ